MRLLSLLLLVSFSVYGFAAEDSEAEQSEGLPDIAAFTEDLVTHEGFYDLLWDEQKGRLHLHIDRLDEPFLYVTSLSAGVGSNDLGLDRGQLGNTRIVHFHRVGSKVLLIEPNQDYRAERGSAMEQRAVAEAFAQSVLASFEVLAQDDGGVVVDGTDWFLSDVHQVAVRLKDAEQGSYKADPKRSYIYLDRTRAFPKNSEIDAVVTFQGSEPGDWVSSVTPTAEALSVRMHHSLIQLPDDGFVPRRYDPRTGYFPLSWQDYSVPLSESIHQRLIWRHRLIKKDPQAEISDPVEPLIYYLDPGTPEPIRSALMEGASWWAQAFEAAGFRNAFRVELLPEDVDPMDVRFNVIQWVHRSTRGWSYGASVIDPRTGEIIKGHISLGSLRVRQDQLIAEAITAPFTDPAMRSSPQAEALALARLRQLSAHEVGHTLGLAHNFAASAYGRESVMDYPHPLIVLNEDGGFDLSQAYDVGIGEWDKLAIRWGYADWGSEPANQDGLQQTVTQMRERGFSYISDPNARGPAALHPTAHLWDNGSDPVAELHRVMQVRAAGLGNFGEAVLRGGTPMIDMETALVPLYLMHRYQAEAAAHVIGGRQFRHALRGDGEFAVELVSPELQRKALDALLATLSVEALILDESLLQLLPPAPIGYGRHREHFSHTTGRAFDALAPARAASDLMVSFLLNPDRASRLLEQQARDPKQPGLDSVINGLLQRSFAPFAKGMRGAVQKTVAWSAFVGVQQLALQKNLPLVRATARAALVDLGTQLKRRRGKANDGGFSQMLIAEIEQLLSAPDRYQPIEPTQPPPGSPIGID